MGSESSAMERQEGDGNGSDRARSVSPLPRYDNSQNGDNDDLDLPKFALTQPTRKATRADSPGRRPHAVSEPDYPDRQGERVHKKKKRKKKKKRQSLGADEAAEGEVESQEHVAGTAAEPEEEEHTEQRKPKKKKKKRHRSSSSQQLPGEEDGDQILEPRSPLAVIASSPPAWRSNREGKGRKNKSAREDEQEAAVEPGNEDNAVSGNEEVIPSSVKTPGKSPGKRARRGSSSSKKSKRQRLASPFGIEGTASQFQRFGPPESPSLVAGRRNENARVPAIEEEESQPVSISSNVEATRPPGPSQWTQSSSYQWPPHDETLKAGPESDEEPSSRSEEQGLPRVRLDETIDTAAVDIAPKAGPEGDLNPPQSAQAPSRHDLMEVDGLPRLDLDRDEIESATSGDEVIRPRSKDLSIDSESEVVKDSAEDPEAPVSAHSPGEEENMVSSTRQGALADDRGNTRRRAPTPPNRQSEDEAESASRANEASRETSHSEEAEGRDDEDASPEPTTQRTPTRSRRKRAKDVYDVQGSPAKVARENPANEEAAAAAASSPPKSSAKAPGSRKSAKRKVKTPYFAREDDEENAAAFAELPGDDAAEPPRKRRKPLPAGSKKRKPPSGDAEDEDAPLPDGRYRTGALTAREQKQVRDAVEAFRESESLPKEELVRVIHTNPQQAKGRIYGELWSSVVEACPTRRRQKLITWCRQNYHNFVARGTWTKEQDDELMDMIERHGKKWAHIGGLINRLPMDCRDRYRNHLVCRDTVKLDYWSKEEEEKLYEAVQIAAKRIREDKTLEKADDETIELLINWQLISEAMGHTRNRLQCMKKWKQLGEKELIPEQLSAVLPPDSSFRLSMTRKDLKKIDSRDKYQLVRFIRDSGAKTDSKIKWKALVSDVFEDKYERKALTVTWARLRATVPQGGESSLRTTQECAEYLCGVYEAEGGFRDAGTESNPSSAVPSRKSSPLKSIRSLSPGSATARLKARGYRTSRTGTMSGRGSRGGSIAGTPAPGTLVGRLSEQAMARAFQGRRRSGVASRSKDVETEVIEDSAAEEEAQEEEVPGEEDVDAPPREPTPSSDEEPAPSPVRRQREPSIDLGLDSDIPTGTPPLRPSPKQPRLTPRTYSARGKTLAMRKTMAQNAKVLKNRRSLIASSQQPESEAEGSTPRRLKKVRLSSRNGAEVLRALPDQDDEDMNLASSPERNGFGSRKTSANGAELSSTNKRMKTAQNAHSLEEPTSSGWTAINNSMGANGSSTVPVLSQPVDARSDISSDMDDMDDIPARLPASAS
jgi:hypothetical protein